MVININYFKDVQKGMDNRCAQVWMGQNSPLCDFSPVSGKRWGGGCSKPLYFYRWHLMLLFCVFFCHSKFCHNHQWCKEDCQSKVLNTKLTIFSFHFDLVFSSGAKYVHLPPVLTMLQWWGPPCPWCLLSFSASAAEWGWSRASPQTQASHSLSASSQSQASSALWLKENKRQREKKMSDKITIITNGGLI